MEGNGLPGRAENGAETGVGSESSEATDVLAVLPWEPLGERAAR